MTKYVEDTWRSWSLHLSSFLFFVEAMSHFLMKCDVVTNPFGIIWVIWVIHLKSRSFWGSYQPSLQRVWNPPQYRASHWISTDQYRASNCVQVKLKKNALKRATADGGHVDHVGASWIVIEVVRMKNDWRILSFIWHVEVSGWQLQLIL